MKIVQLNSYCNIGSTGKICATINEYLNQQGIENYVLYDYGFSTNKNQIKIGNILYNKVQAFRAKVLGNYGFNSHLKTYRIINYINKINPNIIHLHNIHAHFCNIKILFDYLSKTKSKVLWTLHDNYIVTAYCSSFNDINCKKWKKECCNCPKCREYSWIFDRSAEMFFKKRDLLSSTNLSLTTPSEYLKAIVSETFLSQFNIEVVNNGIDLSKFYPREKVLRKENGISKEKKIILLVTGKAINKGEEYIKTIIEFSKLIDFNIFSFVLVGDFPPSIKNIANGNNIIIYTPIFDQNRLAQMYSSADVLVNPTMADIFGLVNVESLACGVPVVMFDTDGAPECIDNKSGIVVEKGNVYEMYKAVKKVCYGENYCLENCVNRAKKFSNENMVKNYYKIYKKMTE